MLRAAALLMVATLGVSACRSEPSAKRVADDLINTLAKTDEERDCMLTKVDAIGKDKLEKIGTDAADGDAASKAAANAELDKLEADLKSCLK